MTQKQLNEDKDLRLQQIKFLKAVWNENKTVLNNRVNTIHPDTDVKTAIKILTSPSLQSSH